MITLTTPPEINSVLGGNTPVAYDKLVIAPFTFDPVGLMINANLQLSSTTVPTMQVIRGTLQINTSNGQLTIEVPQLDFYRKISLSGGQLTSAQTVVTNAQNALEAALVTLGLIAGVQSAGV
jgi:hypothetical protein